MDKKKFEKIMDEWAAHEMEAAPDIQPTPEVYQKLEDKKKRPRFALFSWPIRLAAAGIAAALIIMVIVLQPPKKVEPLLGLRKAAVKEKPGREESVDRMQVLGEEKAEEQADAEVKEEIAGKAEKSKMQEKIAQEPKDEVKKEGAEKLKDKDLPTKTETARKTQEVEEVNEADKEAMVRSRANEDMSRMKIKPIAAAAAPAVAVPERMEFQFQLEGSGAVEKRDMRSPQEEITYLSTEDNYRLLLQLPQERYVFVFQVGADKQLMRLFPNMAYNPAQNPIQAEKTTFIPSPPNWFYVEKGIGEVLVYVVISAEPIQEWDEIYADYSRSEETQARRKLAMGLLDRIDLRKQNPENQISIHIFKFNVR
jgi:cytoskeletal protein RodZ